MEGWFLCERAQHDGHPSSHDAGLSLFLALRAYSYCPLGARPRDLWVQGPVISGCKAQLCPGDRRGVACMVFESRPLCPLTKAKPYTCPIPALYLPSHLRSRDEPKRATTFAAASTSGTPQTHSPSSAYKYAEATRTQKHQRTQTPEHSHLHRHLHTYTYSYTCTPKSPH